MATVDMTNHTCYEDVGYTYDDDEDDDDHFIGNIWDGHNIFQPSNPLSWNENILDIDGAHVDIVRSWLKPEQADKLYHNIMRKATFIQRKRRSISGGIVTDDRLTFRCFDPPKAIDFVDPEILSKISSPNYNSSYHYINDRENIKKGTNKHTNEHEISSRWLPELDSIRNYLNNTFDLEINSCLINCYRDGRDGIGYHADKEVKSPLYMVVSLSLGQSRDFYFKPKDKNGRTLKTVLRNGDLCMMYGSTQELYKHTIPKRTGRNNVGMKIRLSITFREL